MFDEINRIIPKMKENDKKVIYQNIINKSEEKKNLNIFKNKFFYATCSLVIIVLIIPVIYILSINGGIIKGEANMDGTENNSPNDIFNGNTGENEPSSDGKKEDQISIGNGIAYVTHSGCYFTNSYYVLLIKITNLNAEKIYIKEFDEKNSIIDVVAKDYEDIITYENSVYTIEIKDLENIEIEVRYKKQTFDTDQAVSSINLKYYISASNNSNDNYDYQTNEYVIEDYKIKEEE